MKLIAKGIVKSRFLILAIGIALMIPAFICYTQTRINYDILSYLPEDLESMRGQNIMVDDFGTGAFSLFMVEGMDYKDVASLKAEIETVDHVKEVIWYDSVLDIDIPAQLLPDRLYEAFNCDDSTLMAIIFDTSMSADETMDAIEEIRDLADERCFLSGMSALVTDTKNLSNKETPIYVCIAVILSSVILALFMDSFLIPVLFLLSIGMAIIYNLGTNIFLGQISYITQALAAVLQLGTTMDYSIFLWHSYKEAQTNMEQQGGVVCKDGTIGIDKKEAMAQAIEATFASVLGSSTTTIAGFVSLCFMSFTLGLDLGVVMAKGVLFGVICCVTLLPSMILIFDKAIEKTSHKPLLPKFRKLPGFVTKYYPVILILFAIIWVPAIWGYTHTSVYYNLDSTLPEDLPSVVANTKLEDEFHLNTTEMILLDADLSSKEVYEMCEEIRTVDGVKSILGIDALVGPEIPRAFLPDQIEGKMRNDKYQYMLVMSEYKVASDEVNLQCEEISNIIKSYDPSGMLIGEAPGTKDLIEVTDHDFQVVSAVSIGVIFVIILVVFKSISLPFILVSAIEFAIFINMGIPYYTGTKLPFVASIVIGTIQLGSTVDYAILMTNRYKVERADGHTKKEAVLTAAMTSVSSIFVSALSFFAATFGVGLYSDIDMISSLCTLMARGALISMVVVMLVLPALFMLCDPLIVHTSIGFLPERETHHILKGKRRLS